MPIRLRFAEMREEIDHFKVIARDLLDSDGEKVLTRYCDDLTAIQSLPQGKEYPWQITTNRPLRTIESVGEYEANGRRGKHQRLIVEMTCIWEIIPIASQGKKRKPGKIEVFEVGGLASTRVNMRELTGPEGKDSLGSWRMGSLGHVTRRVAFSTLKYSERTAETSGHFRIRCPYLVFRAFSSRPLPFSNLRSARSSRTSGSRRPDKE